MRNNGDQDLIDCIVLSVESAASNAGLDTDIAKRIARAVESDVMREYGGDRLYVRAPSKKGRNGQIIQDWNNGVSRMDIAKEHDITVRTVNRVISNYLNNSASKNYGSTEWQQR